MSNKRGILKTSLVSDLKSIWEAITPEEIKDIEVFRASMEIFIEMLEKYCQPSIDISNTFIDDSLREEFIKTYNSILYATLMDLKTNTVFFTNNEEFRIQTNGYDLIDLGLIKNAQEFLSNDDLIVFRKMLQSGGLKEGIQFLYKWISYHSNELTGDLTITEVQPFEFEMEGSISKIVYDLFVKVLQHPMGFQYTYYKLLKLDFSNPFDQDYWYNRNNMFQLTPEVIDGAGIYTDDFWQNHNNQYLKPFSSQDFPEMQDWETYEFVFTKVDLSVQQWFPAQPYVKISLLEVLDQNMESTGVAVSVSKYLKYQTETNIQTHFEFDNGYKALLLEEFMGNGRKTFFYYDENGNEIFKVGYNQNYNVDLLEEDMIYFFLEGSTTVLDYLTDMIEQYIDDYAERTPQEAEVPNDWVIDEEPTDKNSAFANQIYFINYQDLDEIQKPLIFDFLPSGTPVGDNTPFNNDVDSPQLMGTLQEDSYKSYENWDDQYFDWNLPIRKQDNYDKVFQLFHQDQKFFFSPLNYEPWQLFSGNQIPGKQNYGWWTRSEHEWKFIGQNSGRPVTVGDGHIINRGVRIVSTIAGFRKELPLPSPYLQSQTPNLELGRKYWQPKQGIYTPKIGEVPNVIGGGLPQINHPDGTLFIGQNYDESLGDEQTQYQEYLNARGQGFYANQYDGESNFLSLVPDENGEFSLMINTIEGQIGYQYQTEITIDDSSGENELVVNYHPQSHLTDTFFYDEETEETIYAKDDSKSKVYWFEMPQQRIEKTPDGDIHTFYRPISPRQEEFNYMYFEAKSGDLYDPVNLQYRTLESFNIEVIPVP